jgi:hypothetical protein
MRKTRILVLLTMALLGAVSVQAGPRLKLLLRKVVQLKEGILVVMPILPDSVLVEKLKQQGKEAKLDQYLSRVDKANQQILDHWGSEYDFSSARSVPDSVPMATWADYRAFIAQLPEEGIFVLQFGYAVQYLKPTYRKIKKYDRDFWGIYESDGTTRVYLNAGKAELFWQPHYVIGILESLNGNLHRYYRQAEKAGLVKQGKVLKS